MAKGQYIETPKTLEWVDVANNLLTTLSQLAHTSQAHKLEKQKQIDLSIIQLLSNERTNVRREISKYEDILRGKGIYEGIDEKYKTSSFNSLANLLKDGRVKDYDELALRLEEGIGDLGETLAAYSKANQQYGEGIKKRKILAEQYSDIGIGEQDWEQFTLSGEAAYGPEGDISFTPGSELEMIFNPSVIQKNLAVANSILNSDKQLEALQGSKFGNKISTIDELEQFKIDQEGLYTSLMGPDEQPVLDVNQFVSEAYSTGFEAGRIDKKTADSLLVADLQIKNARISTLNKEYEAAAEALGKSIDALGKPSFPNLTFTTGKANATSINLNQLMFNMTDKVGGGEELYAEIMANLQVSSPELHSDISKILIEFMDTSGVPGARFLTLVEAQGKVYKWEQKALLIHNNILKAIGGDDFTAYVRANPDDALVTELNDLFAKINAYAKVGISADSMGMGVLQKASETGTLDDINLENYTDDMISATGRRDLLNIKELREAQLYEESLDDKTKRSQRKQILSRSTTSGNQTDVDEALAFGLLPEKYAGIHGGAVEALGATLSRTGLDDIADEISIRYGIADWETFGSLEAFKEAAVNVLAQSKIANDPTLFAEARASLDREFNELKAQPDQPIMGPGAGYRDPWGAPYGGGGTFTMFNSLYNMMDDVNESLNQITLLGLPTEGLLGGKEIIQRARTREEDAWRDYQEYISGLPSHARDLTFDEFLADYDIIGGSEAYPR